MFDSKANNDRVVVEYIDGHQWRLLENFTWFESDLDGGTMIDVPAGFVTDFASIPRVLWNWLPPTYYAKPAILHDFLYYYGKVGDTPVTRAEADKVFRDALGETGVNKARRWLMWMGVRVGGGRAWATYRSLDAEREKLEKLTK